MSRHLYAGAVLCLLVILNASVALAGAANADQGTRVNLGPLWDAISPYIVTLISTLLIALLTWATALLQKWTGIKIEATRRDALHKAVMTGVLQGINQVGEMADSMSVDAKNRVVADASRWVLRSVPDAVKYFNVSNDDLRTLIESKLAAIQQPGVEARVH